MYGQSTSYRMSDSVRQSKAGCSIKNMNIVPSVPVPRDMDMEAERLQLFGGEPGDDVGLCYKMLEAFGRMEWIDT